MRIDLKNIDKELKAPDFKNVLLIDFEGKSDFQVFSILDGPFPKMDGKGLSRDAEKILDAMFSFAYIKNRTFEIATIGIDMFHSTDTYKDDLFEKLDKLLETKNTFSFVIGTINHYSDTVDIVGRWAEKNDKIYFISLENEEDLENIQKKRYPNIVALKSGRFVYEAEAMIIDLHCLFFNELPSNMKIENVARETKTVNGELLSEKIFNILFKSELVFYLKNGISYYPITTDNYQDVAKIVLTRTLHPMNEYFRMRPTSFRLNYLEVPNNNNKYDLSLVYFLNDTRQEIVFEF